MWPRGNRAYTIESLHYTYRLESELRWRTLEKTDDILLLGSVRGEPPVHSRLTRLAAAVSGLGGRTGGDVNYNATDARHTSKAPSTRLPRTLCGSPLPERQRQGELSLEVITRKVLVPASLNSSDMTSPQVVRTIRATHVTAGDRVSRDAKKGFPADGRRDSVAHTRRAKPLARSCCHRRIQHVSWSGSSSRKVSCV